MTPLYCRSARISCRKGRETVLLGSFCWGRDVFFLFLVVFVGLFCSCSHQKDSRRFLSCGTGFPTHSREGRFFVKGVRRKEAFFYRFMTPGLDCIDRCWSVDGRNFSTEPRQKKNEPGVPPVVKQIGHLVAISIQRASDRLAVFCGLYALQARSIKFNLTNDAIVCGGIMFTVGRCRGGIAL